METLKSLERQLKQDAQQSGMVELTPYESVEEYAINGNDLCQLFRNYSSSLLLYLLAEADWNRGEAERAKIARRITLAIIAILKFRLRIKS